MKTALLSNVNMDFVLRMLKEETDVYQGEGYGNELGLLLNPESSYHAFSPQMTFIVLDYMELLEHNLEVSAAKARVDRWFSMFEGTIDKSAIYYISDAYLWGAEMDVVFDEGLKLRLEQIWQSKLEQACSKYSNVRIFPYRKMIESMGAENAFSMKMWYMGKILLSRDAQERMCHIVLDYIALEKRTPKKVLLLDLDNTLWGGIAGENDHTPIVLSDDHKGLAYKNLQRVILQMQKQGVILGIVSKNNVDDVQDILEKHPHMVLRPECFAIQKINWEQKHINILEIAKELNLGTDSFVFFDDNDTERELIKQMLPEVAVPDFPKKPENLADAMVNIYKDYFKKTYITKEDLEKTDQYAANAKRAAMQESVVDFNDYLRQLEIVITSVDPAKHAERFLQLVNKTNQFNLTTQRYTAEELQQIFNSSSKKVYFYGVADKFGDNGLVAAVIVDVSGDVPYIEEFAMSCRVMGKRIEQAILDDIETKLQKEGYERLRGVYIPTAKNKPVAELYKQLGYQQVQAATELDGLKAEMGTEAEVYELLLTEKPARTYIAEMKSEV